MFYIILKGTTLCRIHMETRLPHTHSHLNISRLGCNDTQACSLIYKSLTMSGKSSDKWWKGSFCMENIMKVYEYIYDKQGDTLVNLQLRMATILFKTSQMRYDVKYTALGHKYSCPHYLSSLQVLTEVEASKRIYSLG